MNRAKKDNLLMTTLGLLFFMHIFAIVFFPPTISELVAVGWILCGFGALFFMLSVITLQITGVSSLVDSGVYGVVRHPMYLGALMMFLSHMFLGQHWMVVMGGVVAMGCCYLIILSADERNIENFGDDYRRYMQRVPRMNPLVGLFRVLRRKDVGEDAESF
jgi:protein-S-isoprenylcysteine O-methyltransferase Ste14